MMKTWIYLTAALMTPLFPSVSLLAATGDSTAGILVDTTSDPDGDGITSGRESNLYGTNPGNRDTDGDGLDDFTELSRKLDPLNAGNPGNTNMDWFVSQGYYPFIDISVTVSNRERSTSLDIYYTLNDTNAAAAEVRGFAAVDAASATAFGDLYPMSTMVEGTDVNWGEGVSISGTSPIHVVWDAGVDVGKSVQDLQIRIMGRTHTNLPLHFVTVPADTNGAAFQISRYQGTFSSEYETQMLLWFLLKGQADVSAGELIAQGGPYNGQQLTTSQALIYPVGAMWLADQLGVRLATEQEKLRAMEASSSGGIIQWPMYYVTNKTANAFGIETTDTNAWFFVKD